MYKQFQKAANNPTDKSATVINSAIQIFLDGNKGKTSAYNQLSKYDKNLFIPVSELVSFLKDTIYSTYPELQDHKLLRLSLLIQDGVRGPQPTHSDTKAGQPEEKFGVMVLSKAARGTTYYDVGTKKAPTVDDLKELWPDAPPSLFHKIRTTEEAINALQDYGQLLYAQPQLRKESRVVPQFTTTILDGSHPHCAPACPEGTKRTVLFFVLQPPAMSNANGYSGDEQCSKEKLVFLLYEALLSHKAAFLASERFFLLGKFIDCIDESSLLLARDNTFDLPDNWNKAIDAIYQDTKLLLDDNGQVEEQEKEIEAMEEWLQGAKKNLQATKERRQSSKERRQSSLFNAKVAMQGDDYLSEIAEEEKKDLFVHAVDG